MTMIVILVHDSPTFKCGLAWDVLVDKKLPNSIKEELECKLVEYKPDCLYVQKFLKYNKDFEFLGSDDTCHAFGNTRKIVNLIEIVKKYKDITKVYDIENENEIDTINNMELKRNVALPA